MTLSVQYLDDLSRVRVSGSAIPGTHALVERSTDEVRWTPVRGGAPVAVSNSRFVIDDYEFTAGVPNFYRATPVLDEPVNLGMAGAVTTSGDGAVVTLDDTFSPLYIGGKIVRLVLTVDRFDRLGDLSFYLGRQGGLTNHVRWTFNARTASADIGKDGERFTIDLSAAEIRSVGGNVTLSATGELETLTSYTDARLRVTDTGDGPVTVQLHSAELVQAGATTGYVSITFDDGHASVAELAKPKMDALGLVGTNYVVAETVGDTDRVTMADLDEMTEDGWEVGGHAYAAAVHSSNYSGVTRAEAEDDLSALHEWLSTNFPDATGRHSFAYPHGVYAETSDGAAIESIVRRAGFNSGRTILSNAPGTGYLVTAGIPDPMPYRLHAASSLSELSGGQLNPDNLTAQGGMLDKIESNDGGWLILVFHRIIDDSDSPELLTNNQFAEDVADWHAFGGATLAWSSTGGGSAEITPPGDVAVVEFGRPSATRPAVTPGATYRVTSAAAMTNVGQFPKPGRLVLRWYDANGDVISDTVGDSKNLAAAVQDFEVVGEAPAGAASVSPRFWYGETGNGPAAEQLLYVTYMSMTEVVLPSATSEITKSGFDKIMDAIAARNLRVATVRDVLAQHQAVITPKLDSPWLKSITRPYLNHPVTLYEFGAEQRRARSGVFDVVGRTYPVAVTDVRRSREQEIQLLTENRSEQDALNYILGTGETLFLHMPDADCPIDSRYITVGTTSVSRTPYRYTKRRVYSLPTVEVAKPDVSIVGVTNTWENVTTTHATWADLVADVDTWADLVDEVADAEDVIVP